MSTVQTAAPQSSEAVKVTVVSPTQSQNHEASSCSPEDQRNLEFGFKLSGRAISYDRRIDAEEEKKKRERRPSITDRFTRSVTRARQWGKFKLRSNNDDESEDWWFAGTAIPLIAATIAPLANVMSIAALVGSWRIHLRDAQGNTISELDGIPYDDPHWCYALNLASLVCGYIGNLFLLMNFTNRIRYIIALPATIMLWYLSTGILIAITISMHIYTPPGEFDTYSQSYWYAVISATLYCICSMILMINMLGYFLGHYQEHFSLTEAQRTLILQTFLFFIWMAGGAGMFSAVETRYGAPGTAGAWSYANGLYFCDVTILTVGFGDLTPTSNAGRGLVLPYALGGIVILGLMISSISSFASELSQDNIVKKRINKKREKTLGRSLTAERTLSETGSQRPDTVQRRDWGNISISRPIGTDQMSSKDAESASDDNHTLSYKQPIAFSGGIIKQVKKTGTMILGGNLTGSKVKQSRLHLLREEKDRFDAMRRIQHGNSKFKKWAALIISFLVFVFLWAVGAVVFWQVESPVQQFTYFESLYFCYVSLLTIGYGDFAPKSSAGRPFFVVWSLLAIPSITILISDMSTTVISSFKNATSSLADLTILPKAGIWRDFLNRHPSLISWLQIRAERKAARKRLERGFEAGPGPDEEMDLGIIAAAEPHTLDELAAEDGTHQPSCHEMAQRLALAISRAATDVRADRAKKYSYEEWVLFTELIRFTSKRRALRSRRRHREEEKDREAQAEAEAEAQKEEEEEEGLIEWDWIGNDSPMLADKTECEWLLDRLCESMARYVKNFAMAETNQPMVTSLEVNNPEMNNINNNNNKPPATEKSL